MRGHKTTSVSHQACAARIAREPVFGSGACVQAEEEERVTAALRQAAGVAVDADGDTAMADAAGGAAADDAADAMLAATRGHSASVAQRMAGGGQTHAAVQPGGEGGGDGAIVPTAAAASGAFDGVLIDGFRVPEVRRQRRLHPQPLHPRTAPAPTASCISSFINSEAFMTTGVNRHGCQQSIACTLNAQASQVVEADRRRRSWPSACIGTMRVQLAPRAVRENNPRLQSPPSRAAHYVRVPCNPRMSACMFCMDRVLDQPRQAVCPSHAWLPEEVALAASH